MSYRYSKSVVTGQDADVIARFMKEMLYVEFTQWLIDNTVARIEDMLQDYSIEELYRTTDSRGIALAELLDYRRQCLITWRNDLEEAELY